MPSTIAPANGDYHDFAHLFPMMTTNAHRELTEDIKKNGLMHPIVTHEGKIIDGRNRFAACKAAGVEPRYQELPEGVDPLAFVVSTNYTRRHLSESQRALAAARIISHDVKQEDAKSTFKVSAGAIKNAQTVLEKGIPDLIEAVEHDHIPVALAAKIAVLPEEVQEEACSLKVAELRQLIKKQARIKKIVKVQKAAQGAEGKYSVIYADPPWQFQTFSIAGQSRSAENHYDTMPLDAIKEMAIPKADNCVIYLWATVPMLPQALEVMKAWGFDYKSSFVWTKDKIATGYWNRNRHELLLVGTSGTIPAPSPGSLVDSVFDCPTDGHSTKPNDVREMIAHAYPELKKIEMFARARYDGWAAHGDQLPELEDQDQAAD